MTKDIIQLKCVCFDFSIEEVAKAYDTIEEARRKTGCGSGCGLCIPYLEAMMKNKRDRHADPS